MIIVVGLPKSLANAMAEDEESAAVQKEPVSEGAKAWNNAVQKGADHAIAEMEAAEKDDPKTKLAKKKAGKKKEAERQPAENKADEKNEKRGKPTRRKRQTGKPTRRKSREASGRDESRREESGGACKESRRCRGCNFRSCK